MQGLFQRCSNQKTISRWQVQSSYARPETFHKLAKIIFNTKAKASFNMFVQIFKIFLTKLSFLLLLTNSKFKEKFTFSACKFRQIYFQISSKKNSKIRWLTNLKWKDSWQSKLLSTRKSVRFQIQDFFKISLFKLPRPLFKYPSQIIVQVTIYLLF